LHIRKRVELVGRAAEHVSMGEIKLACSVGDRLFSESGMRIRSVAMVRNVGLKSLSFSVGRRSSTLAQNACLPPIAESGKFA
jgi:hypothetical protein